MSDLNSVEVAINTTELHPQAFSRVQSVADLFEVTPRTIKSWYKAGKFIEPVNINGILLFKNSDLIAWIGKQQSVTNEAQIMTTQSERPKTRRQTQDDTIKAHLLAGKKITSWEAIQAYRITTLAQRIQVLRRRGMIIQSRLVRANGANFSEYWIEAAHQSAIKSNRRTGDTI